MKRMIAFWGALLYSSMIFAQQPGTAQPAVQQPAAQPAPPPAAEQPAGANQSAVVKNTIAVHIVGVANESERKALGNEITQNLVASGRFAPAERPGDFMTAAVYEEATKGRISDLQIREYAKQYGIAFVCVADVMEVFGTSQIMTRIVDVATGKIVTVGKDYNNLKTVNDFASVSNKITESMVAGLPPDIAPAPATVADIAAAAPTISPPAAQAPPPPPPAVPAIPAEMLQAISDDAQNLFSSGQANLQSQNYDGAIADYSEVIKLDPNMIYALIARGAAYYSKGDYQGAVDDYTRSIELEPNDAGIFNSRASAYRQLGNYEMAAADYQAALRIDPNNSEAREALELIMLEKDGESDDAEIMDVEKKKPKERKPRYKGKRMYGVVGAGSFQSIIMRDHFITTDDRNFTGYGYSGGLAGSAPVFGRLTLEVEINYLHRSLSQKRDSGIKVILEESAISIPYMLRFVSAPPTNTLAFYLEYGYQMDIPFGTTLRADGFNADPVKINYRNTINHRLVAGVGAAIKAGPMFYVGYRVIPTLNDFTDGGGGGFLIQHDTRVSVMF